MSVPPRWGHGGCRTRHRPRPPRSKTIERSRAIVGWMTLHLSTANSPSRCRSRLDRVMVDVERGTAHDLLDQDHRAKPSDCRVDDAPPIHREQPITMSVPPRQGHGRCRTRHRPPTSTIKTIERSRAIVGWMTLHPSTASSPSRRQSRLDRVMVDVKSDIHPTIGPSASCDGPRAERRERRAG